MGGLSVWCKVLTTRYDGQFIYSHLGNRPSLVASVPSVG